MDKAARVAGRGDRALRIPRLTLAETGGRVRKADVHRVFHALGDPTRRTIVEKLSNGPVTVSQLAGPLKITLAAVVQHLQVLEASGLVHTTKLGRVRTCRIEPQGLSIAAQWLEDRRQLWEKRFDQLGDLLAEDEA